MAQSDDAAALPGGQRTAATVALTRLADRNGVDADREPVAADGLSGERRHMLHERHAARQVTAVGEEARERLGRLDDEQISELAERRRYGSRRARSARWRWRSRSAMAGDRRDPGETVAETPISMIASVRAPAIIARSGAGATPCAARAYTVAAARRRSGGCGRAANGRARRQPDRPRRLRRRRSPAERR